MVPDYSELLQRIREAAGDPNGKLMQDELVDHIAKLCSAAKLCGLWFDEWELILPPDARESFRNELLSSVKAAEVKP
jgi:hypothetical protein